MSKLNYATARNFVFAVCVNLICLVVLIVAAAGNYSPHLFAAVGGHGSWLNYVPPVICLALIGGAIFHFKKDHEKRGFVLTMTSPVAVSLLMIWYGRFTDLVLSLFAIGCVSLFWNLAFLRDAKPWIGVVCLLLFAVLFFLPNRGVHN